MKSLHNSNEISPDMAPTSINSGTYQTVHTMISAGSGSGVANDVLCIKHSVAIVYESRHCKACQCFPHYVQCKLVGHSWPGLYKPLYSMPELAICFFQDLCFKFGISLFLPLCLLISPLRIGFNLSFILLSFTFYIETPPLVKKHVKKNKSLPK